MESIPNDILNILLEYYHFIRISGQTTRISVQVPRSQLIWVQVPRSPDSFQTVAQSPGHQSDYNANRPKSPGHLNDPQANFPCPPVIAMFLRPADPVPRSHKPSQLVGAHLSRSSPPVTILPWPSYTCVPATLSKSPGHTNKP